MALTIQDVRNKYHPSQGLEASVLQSEQFSESESTVEKRKHSTSVSTKQQGSGYHCIAIGYCAHACAFFILTMAALFLLDVRFTNLQREWLLFQQQTVTNLAISAARLVGQLLNREQPKSVRPSVRPARPRPSACVMATPRVAVIGAGMSGLACARALAASGACSVTVLEKARGIGGRCASFTWRGSVVDHGVQFFTLRSSSMQRLVEDELRFGALDARGDIRSLALSAVVTAGDHSPIPIRGGERMYHVGGNKRLAERMGEGLDVRLGCEVKDMQSDGHVEWSCGEETFVDNFDAVVCSAPLPQSAALLDVPTPEEWDESFAENLTLVLEYDTALLQRDCLAHRDSATNRGSRMYAQYPTSDQTLAWGACENAKDGRVIAPGKTVMVAQAGDRFSNRHYQNVRQNTSWLAAEGDPAYAKEMIGELEDMWRIPAKARVANFSKRWKYARVKEGARVRDVSHLENPADRIWFCGDGVARRSRLEHALLNGHHAGIHLAAVLTSGGDELSWSPA